MMDKIDLVIEKLTEVSNKLDILINAIAEDEPEQEVFDLDGNSIGFERDSNQEL